MDEAALIALVQKAISLYETTNCLEYISEELQKRIRNHPLLKTVGNPEQIRMILVRDVLAGRPVEIRRETRQEYQHRREFWYRVNVPIQGFPDPLFFELELTDDDCDYPSVAILNVHF